MIAAIVLAAGAGSRFDGGSEPKLRAPFRGAPLVTWAVRAAVDARVGPVFVVTGAVALDDVLADVLHDDVIDDVTLVPNRDWADGQATSLHAGIATARAALVDLAAVVVGLGDQPLVPADAWRRVAASDGSAIATATFNGVRRPPVRLTASSWSLLPTTGDDGARTVMRARPDLVTEVPCPGEPVDIDTVEELERWS